jgi:hypothetical protein
MHLLPLENKKGTMAGTTILYTVPRQGNHPSIDGYPEGLLATPNEDGYLRIIVPRSQIKALVLQCHEDIHHQSHIKVFYILQLLFYWPGMNISID